MNIPHNNTATCLVKCRGRECAERCILAKGLHRFRCKNAFPTEGRNCIFAARFLLSGDFYGVGKEISQIVKKALVFGHSIAKHVPKQGATHLGQ